MLLAACAADAQTAITSNLTKEQIIDNYLTNGAWRVSYFSPEYQMYIDSAIALNPNIAYLYQQKAMPYFKQSKYEAGIAILDKAIELDAPTHIDYRAFIKCIFAKTYQEAIADFIISKKLKGEHGYVMDHSYDFYIGLCYLQLNQFQKAQDHLNKSIDHTTKTNGADWVHHLDLFYAGIVMQELGRHNEAIEYFDRALKNYSTFSDAKYYKAVSLSRTKKYDLAKYIMEECRADFNKGFTINEDNAIYENYPYQVKKFYIQM